MTSRHSPVHAGQTPNTTIPDAPSIPAIDHGSGSAGNDPCEPTQKERTGGKRRNNDPAGQAPPASDAVVRIGSPEPKPDGKGKLRKVDVGPAPAPVVFDPTHRAAVAANIGVTGELRAQCDAAFQDINKGFLKRGTLGS